MFNQKMNHLNSAFCKGGAGRVIASTLVGCALTVASITAQAGDAALLDCPLRDAPFSLDLPLMDVLLSPEAKSLVDRELPTLLKGLPERLTQTEGPSLSAIMTLRRVTAMKRLDAEQVKAFEPKLMALKVTDADRRARCARYDNQVPTLDLPKADVNVLVFHKINGFDHGPSVDAATNAVKKLGAELGWAVATTDKGGVFNPESLAKFDLVVWNNVSGDVLTLSQRKVFENYINGGGGFLGIHGSGGDSDYFWDWYVNTLLGAQFIGHPMEPQFQDAELHIEQTASGIGSELAPGWSMNDEWYSFKESARLKGASVMATLDESTYKPEGMFGQNLRMGEDHPIVWTRCVADGRSLYTAIGHRPEVYEIPQNLALLKDGLVWAAGKGQTLCQSSKQVANK